MTLTFRFCFCKKYAFVKMLRTMTVDYFENLVCSHLSFLYNIVYTIFIILAIRENMLILQISTAHPDSAKRLLPAHEHAQRCLCNEQQRKNTFVAQLVVSKSWLDVKCYIKSWIVMKLLNLLIPSPLSRTLHPQFFPIRRTTWTQTSNPWKPIVKCIVRPQKEPHSEPKLGQGKWN